MHLHYLRTFGLAAMRIPVAVCALSACLSVSAGTKGLSGTALPLPVAVSYSTSAVPTYAAYKFPITNTQSSGITNVWVTISTSVQPSGAATFLKSTLPRTDPAVEPCVADAAKTTISCPIGSIDPGATKTFVAIFNVPTQGTQISMNWEVPAGQGGPNPVPSSNVVLAGNLVTTPMSAAATGNLKKGTDSSVQSYVLDNETLATGVVDISGAKTAVKVPVPAPVSIEQFIPAESCAAIYKTCFNSKLTIQEGAQQVVFSPPFLQIELRRSAATLKGGASIDQAILQYKDTTGPWEDILPCETDGTPIPAGRVNCYQLQTGGQKGLVDPVTKEWVFFLLGNKNGLRAF